MVALWLILKGAGLFLLACVAGIFGTVTASSNITMKPRAFMIWPVAGIVAVVVWCFWIRNGWIAAISAVLIGYALSFVAEKWRIARRTPEEIAGDRMEMDEINRAIAAARAESDAAVAGLDPVHRAELTLVTGIHVSTGGEAFGEKLVGGLLTGGVGAVTQAKVWLGEEVKLPPGCCLCGSKDATENASTTRMFRRGSELAALGGINLSGEAVLTYKVCGYCKERPQQAIEIAEFEKRNEEWHVTLSFLNPAVCDQARALNPKSPGKKVVIE